MFEQFNCSYSLDEFIDVPEPQGNAQALRLSFSRQDQLSQNPALQKELNGTNAFRLRVSPDGRTLLLDPEGPCNMTFTPKGVRTHHPLGRFLRQQGLELPISYQVVWGEELHCWVAQYDGLTHPPMEKQVPASHKKQKKGRNG